MSEDWLINQFIAVAALATGLVLLICVFLSFARNDNSAATLGNLHPAENKRTINPTTAKWLIVFAVLLGVATVAIWVAVKTADERYFRTMQQEENAGH